MIILVHSVQATEKVIKFPNLDKRHSMLGYSDQLHFGGVGYDLQKFNNIVNNCGGYFALNCKMCMLF